jgi:hypothetical protein
MQKSDFVGIVVALHGNQAYWMCHAAPQDILLHWRSKDFSYIIDISEEYIQS